MKKKVKKIPKFNLGGPAYDMLMKTPMPVTSPTFNPVTTNPQSGVTAGTIAAGKEWKDFNKTQKANAVSDAIGGSAALWDMSSSGQDVSVGTAVKGMATGAQAGAAFGPVGMAVGAGLGLLAGTAGRGNKVDVNSASELTSDIAQKGSGWLKPFGMSDEAMYRRANMVANANIATRQSEDIKANYYNNPNVPGSINVLAAEGGIMRKPVDALVSKGELIYDPTTMKLRQVPGSKGKPNKADDVYAKLYEGDVVISNSPTMLMANGKTPAQNLMGMVDKYSTGGTVKAREAIIKKVVNWQEANKTKPQEYAMYDEGTGKDGVESKSIKKRRNSIWNRMQDKWNTSTINDWLENYYNNIDKYEDHAIIDGRLFIKHDGKWYDSHKGGLGRAIKDNVLPESGKGYMTDRYQTVPFKQGVFADVDKSKIVKHKRNNTAVSDIVKPNSNNGKTTNTELDFVSFRHVNPDYDTPKSDIVTNDINSAITESKKGTVGKPSSGKKIAASRVTTSTAPSPEDTVVRRPIYEEPVKTVTVPTDDTKVYDRDGRVAYDYTAPETKVTPQDLGRTVDDNNNYTGSDWRDGLYRMAVLSQPLWGRAKAEPVDYTSPVYKYMPTQIDVSSQLRDADQSYALSRYNFANLYPNTGAGMAAGLQAASNRAKQYADIRQWQTNAQNELIGKNVGIYNNWANEHARILNDVYNKSAQNKAAARNINRQNVATALKNWGQIRRDEKLQDVQSSALNMYAPAIKAVMEDPYSVLNPLYNLNR